MMLLSWNGQSSGISLAIQAQMQGAEERRAWESGDRAIG